MSSKHKIGIDLMGSDNAPDLLLSAVNSLASELPPSIELVVVGDPKYASKTHLRFQAASEIIEMHEDPLLAIRRKRDASLCVGLRMLKEGAIDAFVSAGNTGALVSSAKVTLSTLPGILRPALLALMPTKHSTLAVLDVGANVQCKAEHLIQFALMGAAYQKARGIEKPSIGLLNIGSESIKGTSELRLAWQQLKELSDRAPDLFQFAGNVEGKTVFDGHIDVLITDGFTGNIFLKTAEGVASLVLDRLSENLSKDLWEKMRGELSDLRRHLHYAEYPGALLCGVKGIVIKCHGYSTPKAFANAIREAVRIIQEDFLQTLQNKLVKASQQKG